MNKPLAFILALILFADFAYSEETNKANPQCHLEECCFFEIMNKRHSGFDFDPAKSVDPELLLELANSARLSPSSYNEQPWRFIFCDRDKTPEAYLKALDCLVDANKDWAMDAPVLIVVSANTVFTRNQKPNLWSQFDTGAAVMSLVYRATSLGLMTHEIGGFDEAKIRNEFAISPEFLPMAVIAVGYESESEADTSIVKKRKPIGEHFFWGTWGLGISQGARSLAK